MKTNKKMNEYFGFYLPPNMKDFNLSDSLTEDLDDLESYSIEAASYLEAKRQIFEKLYLKYDDKTIQMEGFFELLQMPANYSEDEFKEKLNSFGELDSKIMNGIIELWCKKGKEEWDFFAEKRMCLLSKETLKILFYNSIQKDIFVSEVIELL